MIDVSNDLPRIVHGGEGARDIDRGVKDEGELRVRKTRPPALRRIEKMGFLISSDSGHEQTLRRGSRRGPEYVRGPRCWV